MKALGLVLVIAAIAVAAHQLAPGGLDALVPEAQVRPSLVPAKAELPQMVEPSNPGASAGTTRMPGTQPGCSNLPEVRIDLWAWNSQMGAMFANGGPQATEGSLMCQHGVNLRFVRQDDPSKMREDLVAFANKLSQGEAHPTTGVHYVAIMGDGGAAFLKELNDVLGRLGPEYKAKVVGSAGYSWGEDRFMGPPSWKERPESSRGGVVAGVLRDGDWNIAQKWLSENQLCNNPDEHTYDPDCLNWVATPGYVEAAEAYVAGYCEERPVVKSGKRTGKKKKVCVDGVVTWTPGDVTVAHKRGGLVSIVSTKEYRGQMPNIIIGIDKWMKSNPALVEGMLAAIFEGSDRVKSDPAALRRAAEISAAVYKEEDGAYWEKYFHGVVETDKQGLQVELGGSRVNNLADNLYLFGVREFAPDSTNLFAVTYTVFGNIVQAQYPDLLSGFQPADEVLDTAYLEALARRSTVKARPDLPAFAATGQVKQVISQRSWEIDFQSGKAEFTPESQKTLEQLFEQLVIASGTVVELHGCAEGTSNAEADQALPQARALAVKEWLERKSRASFPEGRIRVAAQGSQAQAASCEKSAGKAKKNGVQVLLGSADQP
jgi:outer membrane protein OmpA-like peptidoglycan-associated protein